MTVSRFVPSSFILIYFFIAFVMTKMRTMWKEEKILQNEGTHKNKN